MNMVGRGGPKKCTQLNMVDRGGPKKCTQLNMVDIVVRRNAHN